MMYYAVYVKRMKKQNLLFGWRGQKPNIGRIKNVWRPARKSQNHYVRSSRKRSQTTW
jgi:hypothetical protein